MVPQRTSAGSVGPCSTWQCHAGHVPPAWHHRHARLSPRSLHARARLEHLCRYLLRPPLARERLTESAHGPLLFELAHPRADGTTHLLLEPLELIEKIALLIPPPRFQTLRFQGVLGPRAAGRSAVIPRRPEAVEEGPPAAGRSAGTGPRAEPSPGSLGAQSESSRWAALLRRVFALDPFQCPRCGGRRRLVGVHTRGERLRVLLERLGLVIASPSAEPSRPPPRRGA
jgi:hypothetical protein